MYTIADLYDLDHTLAADYLRQFTYPWEALKGIKDLILTLGPTLGSDYEEREPQVWVHKTAKVFASCMSVTATWVSTLPPWLRPVIQHSVSISISRSFFISFFF